MDISLTFLSIIDILSISTAFMLGLLFFTVTSKNKIANVFLGLFLWSLAVEVLESFYRSSSIEQIQIPLTSQFTLVFLLFYVTQTINLTAKKWHYSLFIPGIIINVFIYLNSNVPFINYFEYLFNIAILLYILSILKQHKEKIAHFYSDIENKTLRWIKAIVFIFLGFHLLWVLEDIVGFQNENWVEPFVILSNILTFFMVYWIGYNGFSQSEIFQKNLFNNTEIEEIEIELEKFEALHVRILNEKLFTQQNLTLRILSEIVDIKEKELSKLINLHSKSNFYQFINQFRVVEFKNLLNSPKAKQLSILGLAEEAGFSSKSTFYTTFKGLEGITPKQYEQSLN